MARGALARRLSSAVTRLVRRAAPGPATVAGSGTVAGSATVAGPTSVADEIGYAPHPDGLADPGEIVWGWVPYDEGDGRGKDRPILVVGRRGRDLLGLQLTSKDHDRDAADEARWGRYWTDIGTGDWDARHRPSEVRLDKLLVLDPAQVRREGAALDRARFDRVIAEARRVQGW